MMCSPRRCDGRCSAHTAAPVTSAPSVRCHFMADEVYPRTPWASSTHVGDAQGDDSPLTKSDRASGPLNQSTAVSRVLNRTGGPMQQLRLRVVRTIVSQFNPGALLRVRYRLAATRRCRAIIAGPGPGVQILANASRQLEMTGGMTVTKNTERNCAAGRRQHPMD